MKQKNCKLALMILIFLITGFLNLPAQKFQGLALTLPMGWNTFHWDITEQLIHYVADVMVSSGIQDVGYKYLR
jgi:alpha-galactosidase